MNALVNPFSHQLFAPFALRMGLLLAVGLPLIMIFTIRCGRIDFNHELWKRYASWAIMGPVFILAILCGRITSALLCLVILIRSINEFAAMLHLPRGFRIALLINGLISMLVAILLPGRIPMLPLVYLVVLIGTAVRYNQPDGTNHLAYSVFGSMWIIFLFVHFVRFAEFKQSTLLSAMIGFSVALANIGAYVSGKIFQTVGLGGALVIADRISPKKTLLGCSGTIIGATAGVMLFAPLISGFAPHALILTIMAISCAAVAGDLTESMVKRVANVKDSAHCIPGHGGVLDRIDSLLITVAALFYLFTALDIT
jgi:phosphatidate cytidylyltransferase